MRTVLGSAASARPKPLIPYNPAHIRGAGNVKRAHKVRPASLSELETIVAALPDRYQLMALLAAWCALRFGELAVLRRGDIDLSTKPGVDHSRCGSHRWQVRRRIPEVGSPKSDAGVRDVAIPPHLIPVVKAHLKDYTGKGKDALLFPAAADCNSHLAPSTLYKVCYPARKAAGREDLRWHDLRHTGAVLAAQTGAIPCP